MAETTSGRLAPVAHPIIRDLMRVNPGQPEWPVAVRATASTVVPLLVLWSVGHLEWTPYAAFGAFAALYGRNVPLPRRLRMQAEAGAALVASVALGVVVGISPQRAWLLVPVAAVWVTAMAIVSHRRTWHPPGVLFQAFALGACGSMATVPWSPWPRRRGRPAPSAVCSAWRGRWSACFLPA